MNRINSNPLGLPGEETKEIECDCDDLKPGDRVVVIGEFCDATRTMMVLPMATMLEPRLFDFKSGVATEEELAAVIRERIVEFCNRKLGFKAPDRLVQRMFDATVERFKVRQLQFDDGTIVNETEVTTIGSEGCAGRKLDAMKSLPPDHKLHGTKVAHITNVAEWIAVKRSPIVGHVGAVEEDGTVVKGRPIHALTDITKLKNPRWVVSEVVFPDVDPEIVITTTCSKCSRVCYRHSKESVEFMALPSICVPCFDAMDLKEIVAEERAKREGTDSFTA